jgi:RNA polymerase sigma-70 factor (ECF subfamily)
MTGAPGDEEQLIRMAAQGDADAFGDLVRPHLALFHNGINRILGNTADSQDALQDALIGMYRDLPAFEGRSRFSSWAYKVCIHSALMHRRSRGRNPEPADLPGLGPFDEGGHHLERRGPEWQVEAEAHGLVEKREMRQCLLAALDELPDGHRDVFVLKDLEDWETGDIARHLGLEPAAVRQRLHRARVLVQARLRTFVQGGRP